MKNGEKLKEVKLRMKFNPGTQSYEPMLPTKEGLEKIESKKEEPTKKRKKGWKWIIAIILFLILALSILTGIWDLSP